MDNMLYIIAGLVLILLVAVLVLRKNKAQNPPEQQPIQTGRNAAANAPISTHNEDRHSTAQRDPNSVNKFDNTAIAQRFMDQQRYDKAIETLDRGLIEKPNDNQLLLKLLSVYATTDQLDDFYIVYDAIKTHSDTETINQADELKALLVGEQDQEILPVVTEADNNNGNFDGLDFDLPTAQTVSEKSNEDRVFDTATAETSTSTEKAATTEQSEPVLDLNDTSAANNNVDDTFELTLGDLESADDLESASNLEADTGEPVATNLTPVEQLDMNEEESSVTTDDYLITPATDDPAINESATGNPVAIENTEDDDFTLDFDLPEQATTPTDHTPVDTAEDDSRLEEISLEDDDFVLDFADLAADADLDTDTVAGNNNDTESNAVAAAPATEDDFTLSLEGTDSSDAENKSQIDTPTTPATFDDTTSIDDDFDFDFDPTPSSPTATTPVEVEESIVGLESDIENGNNSVDAETAADFMSRFAADFDFVKTLDSNQVTLDLAEQYLKLGEYDSAKRLLNEVMAQGNSEQQHQAQALLDRTA
ncbi:FimV/HubP family polar landmark protein [Psychrobacter sp. LV10R520-6]|uniref:FimV/HubP family polar landmark protein n=1 Tax=Psychrobacter sp. LV10R520-6 TaxID=1415574 RepID=UPI0024C86BDE|nr:FimV/HubP family polar landmark protein [Psychrobacter sp. LV10R520-6]SNT70109.1 pilus assembly protein FimV [Psychrobacter sp. LV10R520-6]